MNSFAAAHNDYLDPDNYHGDGPEHPNPIAFRPVKCPACGEIAQWFVNTTEPHFTNDLTYTEHEESGWHCENCDWEQEAEEDDYERKVEWDKTLQPRINSCWDAINNHVTTPNKQTPTPAEFFEAISIPEGDFKWDDTEAGDWNVWCCGEKDCPQQWHLVAYAINVYRKNGKLSIDKMVCDGDGNWDCDLGWEQGEEPLDVFCPSFAEVIDSECGDSYFKGWAKYWLDALLTGKDPCDQIIGNWRDKAGTWEEFCLEAAEDHIKYLKM